MEYAYADTHTYYPEQLSPTNKFKSVTVYTREQKYDLQKSY